MVPSVRMVATVAARGEQLHPAFPAALAASDLRSRQGPPYPPGRPSSSGMVGPPWRGPPSAPCPPPTVAAINGHAERRRPDHAARLRYARPPPRAAAIEEVGRSDPVGSPGSISTPGRPSRRRSAPSIIFAAQRRPELDRRRTGAHRSRRANLQTGDYSISKFTQRAEKLDDRMKLTKTNSKQRCVPERAAVLPKRSANRVRTRSAPNDNGNAIFFSVSQELHQWRVG